MKTWDWKRILALIEDTTKAVIQNSKCIDAEKEKINVPKQKRNFQSFRASTSAPKQFQAGRFNEEQFKSKSYDSL